MIIQFNISADKIEYYSEPELVEAKLNFMGRMWKGEGATKPAALRDLKAKIQRALQA